MKTLDILSQATDAIEKLRKCRVGERPLPERRALREEATREPQPYFNRFKTKNQFGKYQSVAEAILFEVTALI